MPQLSPVLGIMIFLLVLCVMFMLMLRETQSVSPPKLPTSKKPKSRSPLLY
uniref:ATP synthase subunit 8 n=1 Tax=Myosotella myosotis TaxID=252580 RepID=G8HMV9_9EUPU|nr:ATP synthase subunit 8 [Myosotella myosotis]